MSNKQQNLSETLGLIRPDKEFGKNLMEAAQENFQKERGEAIVAQVTTLMKELEFARQYERINRENAEMIERKIKAVQAGEFSINSSRQLVFNNGELNKPYAGNMGYRG